MQRLEKIQWIRRRLKEAYALLRACTICPRRCGVNRLHGERGGCAVGKRLMVSSMNLHFGEEPPLSGWRGSGTVFFASCALRCVFCQNYPISQLRHGHEVSVQELASAMLRLQSRGAHNINLVTPTHFGPQIMAGLLLAFEGELDLPIVYNCGGYESVEMLRLWEGIVDIYMPDMKYSDEAYARRYSGVSNYPAVNRTAVAEMHRQVGPLQMDAEGVAQRGVLVRHLVLPEGIAGTEEVMRFLAQEISQDTYISLMRQYFPAHKAVDLPPLNRRITRGEYTAAKRVLERYELERGWVQE